MKYTFDTPGGPAGCQFGGVSQGGPGIRDNGGGPGGIDGVGGGTPGIDGVGGIGG